MLLPLVFNHFIIHIAYTTGLMHRITQFSIRIKERRHLNARKLFESKININTIIRHILQICDNVVLVVVIEILVVNAGIQLLFTDLFRFQICLSFDFYLSSDNCNASLHFLVRQKQTNSTYLIIRIFIVVGLNAYQF